MNSDLSSLFPCYVEIPHDIPVLKQSVSHGRVSCENCSHSKRCSNCRFSCVCGFKGKTKNGIFNHIKSQFNKVSF
jgi:hypothetical protein